jgi:hypothetical protein
MTHAYTHARTQAHAHAHARAHTQARAHTHGRTRTGARARAGGVDALLEMAQRGANAQQEQALCALQHLAGA